GADKAGGLIDRILLGRNTTGLDTLKWMDPRAVADLVRNEHPQIIAIVMAHLDSDQAAEALKLLPERTRADVLGEIGKIDADLAGKIQDLMFVFDNLVDLDDRGLQTLLREVSGERLGLALRGADVKVREKITRNMSQRAAEILLEDMEARGPVRLADVEAAQKEILTIVRRLADEGAISLGGAGAEAMV
ncbi:flagellar motor switch protein FliG, partial [Xanthomonas perforans]|uniref:flagellar motor switch protein FliG n=1 Tax=Xanthomonas perforans TaxID=442694 RepID=UPI00062D3AB1